MAILFGGVSAEHAVSIASALSISKSIDRGLFDPVYVAIDKSGRWFMGESAFDFLQGKNTQSPCRVILSTDPENKGFVDLENFSIITKVDAIFPALHGPRGEDGTIQGLLDLADIPYVGCGTMASAIAMDKDMTKRVLNESGIPVVPGICVNKYSWEENKENILAHVLKSLGLPLFIKPATLGSSIGITNAKKVADIKKGIDAALSFSEKVVIEKAIKNPLEVEVAVLGNHEIKASLAGQIISSNEFYDFEAKYVDVSSELIIPAKIRDDLSKTIRDTAVDSFKAIGGTGLARVDFLISENNYYVNEINTLPGFTKISMYPKLWEATGIPYRSLITRLIELAFERFETLSGLTKTIDIKKGLSV